VVVGVDAGAVVVVVVPVPAVVVVVPGPAVVVVVLDGTVVVVAPDPAVVVVLDGTVVLVVLEVDVVVVDFVTCETSLVPPPSEEVDGLFETGATPHGPVLPERWGTAKGLVGWPACVVPKVRTARKNPAAAAPSTIEPTATGRNT
jgi:hypothetical protein